MMRGPTYDDNYISRKMHSFQSAPTFCPPTCGPSSYDYMQPNFWRRQSSHRKYFPTPNTVVDVWYLPYHSDRLRYVRENTGSSSLACCDVADGQAEPDDHPNLPHDDWLVNPGNPPRSQLRPGHIPSGQTRLILNRIGLSQAGQGYTPRLPPRMGPPPSYYDYDYGGGYGHGGYGGYGSGFGGYGGYRPYGGYGGYGYCPPPPPRYSYRNYDSLLDDDHDVNYVPRYRPGRIADTLSEIQRKELRSSLSPIRDLTITRTSTTAGSPSLPTEFMARNYSPGLGGEGKEGVSSPSKLRPAPLRSGSLERPALTSGLLAPAGDQGRTRTSKTRYNHLSEPQMLQEQVDKMRTRLQAMAFSLDPSGPVPEIVIPERSRRVESGKEFTKKYSSGPKHLACAEFAGSTPQWRRKAMVRLPDEDPLHLSEISQMEFRDAEKAAALEMAELPRLSIRKHQHTYPEDEYMKDNLRIKCLSHYKTTRTAAEKDPERLVLKDRLSLRIHNYLSDTLSPDKFQKYIKTYRTPGPAPLNAQIRTEYWKPKGYYGDEVVTSYTLPSYTSKYASSKSAGAISGGASKWEEPDTVYSKGGDLKPFSKVETGSSFFSTYGYTNRLKDTVAEKVRDYYYDKDDQKPGSSVVHFDRKSTVKTTEGDDDDLKKERRKKKRSKEREEPVAIDSGSSAPASATVPSETSAETTAGDAGDASVGTEEPEMDDKERKRLEKKKRKAEREAAAKAAMEAELAALAEAEAELARLEAESSSLKSSSDTKPDPEPAAPQPPAESSAPAQEENASETVTEKCESPIEAPCEVLPEYPPTESECDPTLLTSSTAQAAEEEEPCRKEEPVSQLPKDESHQDLSAEKPALESEPAEQVTQPQDSLQAPKEGEPEIATSVDDGTGPIVEDSDFFELKSSIKTEFHLSVDPVEAATSDHSNQAPVAKGDDNYEQQIGGGEISVQTEEEQLLEDRSEVHHEQKELTTEQEEEQQFIQDQLTRTDEESGEKIEPDPEQQFQYLEEVQEHLNQEQFGQVPQDYLGQEISDQLQEHPIEEEQLENTGEEPQHTVEQPENTAEQQESTAEQQENTAEEQESTAEQHLEEEIVAKIEENENKDKESDYPEDLKYQEFDPNKTEQDEYTHLEHEQEHLVETDDSNHGQIQQDLAFEDIFAGRGD